MKRFSWILALCLGGSGLFFTATHHPAAALMAQQPAATQQPSATPPPSQTHPAKTAATTPKATPSATKPQTTTLSNNNHYVNSSGNVVHSPAKSSNGVPKGATALCGDGSYSFSQHHQGTCSHHGGVSRWL
jgi:peptidyl-tRNA hydrolase